ncbi:MAG: 4'-phosphopantetheinyl transferase superfamily protein [Drouetiella hepatica Uher 2000/2452]|jgi:holo-[acyl-carrier protein] synthase|uniref:4'-phosphopantetheinyl transferase superfamily protein n=1 Tax=Drouetiella hepatica Uher 2000/2452 TaxID=904376 RepID=A0A951QDW0_9CYAN|nr:4'-phosphopantetheinyl transferase superfamily protein [Drouetiella hepatica Uher 2000/2452]
MAPEIGIAQLGEDLFVRGTLRAPFTNKSFLKLPAPEIKGVGIDIVSIPQIAQLTERYDRHTLMLLFTAGEMDRCQSDPKRDRAFAICFAAKEAIGKALGTGLVDIAWDEIEAVLIQDQLTVELYGEADSQAKQNGIETWIATWCEWDQHILVHILGLAALRLKGK